MKGKRKPVKTYEYYKEIEQPCAKIFSQMSNRGICIDLTYLRRLQNDLEYKKAPLVDAIKNDLGSINLSSPKQLLKALNEKGLYPTFKGKPSTDKRALERFRHNRTVSALLDFSQLDTLLSSFVIPYLQRGQSVIHPFFNQCGTRTGRLSCSNPNLLQIPKHTDNGKLVRKMFIPRPGMQLGDCDFGQIEPRILAHLSKDPNLCGMFANGLDFHQFTADKLGISRDRAKILNLSVGYRATYYSVSQQLKCSEQEAQNEIDKWWSLFPILRRWQNTLIYDAKRSGYCSTIFGRRIKVEGLNESQTWQRESAERQLINNITQGSAAEVMKLAMIEIARCNVLSESFGLLIQVYDELVFESAEIVNDLEIVKVSMEKLSLDVPFVVDAKAGSNWAEVA